MDTPLKNQLNNVKVHNCDRIDDSFHITISRRVVMSERIWKQQEVKNIVVFVGKYFEEIRKRKQASKNY